MKRDSAPIVSILVLLSLCLLIVGVVAFLVVTRPAPIPIVIASPAPTPTAPPTATPLPIQVYITGAVAHPEQVYQLPAGSRVLDLITAAGGSLPNANLEQINLADFLEDGQQVHIFTKPTATPTVTPVPPTAIITPPTPLPPGVAAPTAAPTVAPTAVSMPVATMPLVVNINTATLEELDLLPGIGPAIAQRIIDWRQTYGYFYSMESLEAVPGIGPVMIAELQGLIVFN